MRCALFLLVLSVSTLGFAEDTPQECPYMKGQQQTQTTHENCPFHKTHEAMGLKERGDREMGFSQEKATHHFILTRDGGKILVEANDSQDQETIQLIRRHLKTIPVSFSAGDFIMPHAIHQKTLPGVETMSQSKEKIHYEFIETERGGSVMIQTLDPKALSAVHEFLQSQIEEHKTGDPLHVM